jgi:DNA-binding transcriptional LysR family regulator
MLFQRDSGRLALTRPGEVLLSEAKAILRLFDDAVSLTRETGKREKNRIRIGHSSASSIEALPRVLCRFYKTHPQAKVELRRLRTAEMITCLRRGELDICLTVCGSSTDLAEFRVERLCTYSLLAAFPRQHPLASLETIKLEEFARQRVLSLNRSAFKWYYEYISDFLLAHNPRFKVAEEHDGTEGVIAAVEAGRGVALVYDVMAPTIGGRVVLRQLTPPPPEAPLVLFHQPDRNGPLISGFVEAAEILKQKRFARDGNAI